jgi:hypothetical protein
MTLQHIVMMCGLCGSADRRKKREERARKAEVEGATREGRREGEGGNDEEALADAMRANTELSRQLQQESRRLQDLEACVPSTVRPLVRLCLVWRVCLCAALHVHHDVRCVDCERVMRSGACCEPERSQLVR